MLYTKEIHGKDRHNFWFNIQEKSFFLLFIDFFFYCCNRVNDCVIAISTSSVDGCYEVKLMCKVWCSLFSCLRDERLAGSIELSYTVSDSWRQEDALVTAKPKKD